MGRSRVIAGGPTATPAGPVLGVTTLSGPAEEDLVLSPPSEGSGAPGSGEGSADDATSVWAEPTRRPTRRDPCLVRLNRVIMALSVHRREPRGTEGPFTANGEPIYVFLDFVNTSGSRQRVRVYWRHAATSTQHTDRVEVGTGVRWRTWAARPLTLDRLGEWSVQVVDSGGCLIEEVEFELAAPEW